MNRSRLYDEMDIQAVESKLNDVTVTAIPMSSVGSKSYHHPNQKSATAHNYSTSSSSSSSSKLQKNNQSQQQYLNYQQNQLVQSAIQLIQQQQLQQQQLQQQQLQQQRQQLLENGVSINSTSHSASHSGISHSGSASGSHSYTNYGQNAATTITANGSQLVSAMTQSSSQSSGLSKYAQLLAVIEEMGRDIRPTYAMSRGDRLKRLIIQAKVLVRECLMETERSARQ